MKYLGQRIRVVAAQIEKDGKYLITQRSPHGLLPLLWEFPGGRGRLGETDEEVLHRKLLEKLGISPQVGAVSLEVLHQYPEYTVNMVVYHTRVDETFFLAARVHAWKWVAPEELDAYPFPEADQRTVSQLLEED